MNNILKSTFIFVLSLSVVGCGGGGGGSRNNPASPNLSNDVFNNATIKNISNYKQLALGSKNTSSSSIRASNSNNEDEELKYRTLVGLNITTNSYEIIKYSDVSGSEVEANVYVVNYKPFSDYILCQLSDKPYEFQGSFDGGYPCGIPFYLIHKKTGKIYMLADMDNINVFTMGCYDESNNIFCCNGRKKTDLQNDSGYIYTFTAENNMLKIEKKVDPSKIPDWGSGCRIDRFGNIYSDNFKYLVTRNGKLKSIKGGWKAMNDIVYLGNQQYDENGELVAASFIPDSSFSINCGDKPGITRNTYLIKKNGNDYYYCWEEYQSSFLYNIYKVSYTNSEKLEYAISSISLEEYSEKMLVANDKIYLLKNNEICYCSIETGKKTSLNSEYLFNSMSLNGINIAFKGIDGDMNDVSGIIDANDKIIVNIAEREKSFDVYYVSPLN